MKSFNKNFFKAVLLSGLVTLLGSCNIGQVNLPINITSSNTHVNLGGVVNGLLAGETVTLQNNGADDVLITGSGSGADQFTFATQLSTGDSYFVDVFSQPLTKICIVGGNVGTVASTDVMTVQVNCGGIGYVIGGTVSNLQGSGLVLRINGIENLAVNGNGPFAFSTPLLDGAVFNVVVATQPTSPSQACSVTYGSGTVAAADITTIAVNCVTNSFVVSGTVSGLAAGDSITLQNNSANDTIVTGNSSFTFPALIDGSGYSVTVSIQPSGKTCTPSGGSLGNGTGTLIGADVSVLITCSQGSYSVGGNVTGLVGTLVLRNGSENLSVTANGSFTFLTQYADLISYLVTVNTQPTTQTCTVTSGSGTISGASVTSVNVSCLTHTFTVGGTVTGLPVGGWVTLQNNGADNQTATVSSPTFTFTAQNDGTAYNVTKLSSSIGSTCVVGSGTGVLAGSSITSVSVTCGASPNYTIGGTLTGLDVNGTGLVLQNNGGDDLTLTSNGAFSFATALPDLSSYSVTVLTQPTVPGQVCTLNNPGGTVNGANITSVVVTCATNSYTVGGTINILANPGEWVELQLNGGSNLVVSNPATTFAFPVVINDLNSYNVSVVTTGGGVTCTPSANTGVVNGSPVTTVTVNCSTGGTTYQVGATVSGFSGTTNLMLANNGGDYLAINANGNHYFPTTLGNGQVYNMTVVQQPTNPNTTCAFTGTPSGSVSGTSLTVAMTCSINQYTIGGTVSGLANGESITLQNNTGDDKVVTGAGSSYDGFVFATSINDQTGYNVSVLTPPSGKTCTVGANTGTVNGNNINNVSVNCSAIPKYTVGGAITGLATGGSVTLQNNSGDNLTVSANGVFSFSTALVNGATYSVTVLTNPSQPASANQTCSVTSGGSGTIAAANVTSVNVDCITAQYTISGTVSGLVGSDFVDIVNNGGNSIHIIANGGFTFPLQNDSSTYNVTVGATNSNCVVGSGTGTLAGGNVSNVTVSCSQAGGTYSVGGTISGLVGTVTLRLNNNTNQNFNSNGAYSFSSFLNNTVIYSVIVVFQPAGPNQTCTVSNANGTIAGANVNNVNISCITSTYTIGGNVAGLIAGNSVHVITNGSSAVIVYGPSPAGYTSAPINDGSTNVPVQLTSGPNDKDCNFDFPYSGKNTNVNINGGNVTVNVTCSPLSYGVQAVVTGMTSAGLSGLNLMNYITGNGSNNSPYSGINIDGTYAFALQAPQSNYTVVVSQQPAGGICSVTGGTNSNGTGQMPASPVANENVNVTCSAIGSPTLLTLGSPMINESVGATTSNKYQVSVPSTVSSYVVTATAMNNNVNIYVYSDAGFTNLVCSSTNTGTTNELCSVSGFSNYYIVVLNANASNANFTIKATDPTWICGNGSIETGEACDDNNTLNYDGCSSICVVENPFTIGGQVYGLGGSDSITLNNGPASVVVNGTGASPLSFTFSGSVYDGTGYYITKTAGNHPGKSCTIDYLTQSGTVSGANVTSIVVNCIPIPSYTISGNILGLANLKTVDVTLNGGVETITGIAGTTGAPPKAFNFVTQIQDGGAFTVVVTPGAGVTCAAPTTINGTVNGANVTSLAFSCSGATIVADAYEVDDTAPASTSILPNGVDQFHTFHTATDVDYISLNVDTTALAYTITANQAGGAGSCSAIFPIIQVWNSSETQLMSYVSGTSPGPSQCPSLTYKFPSTGTYYIRIYEGFGTKGNYTLNVRRSLMILQETFASGLGSFTTSDLGSNTTAPYDKWHQVPTTLGNTYGYDSIWVDWVPFYSDGNFAVADSNCGGGSPTSCATYIVNTELVSPVLNCNMVNNVILEYDLMYNNYMGHVIDSVTVQGKSSGATGTNGQWQDIIIYSSVDSGYVHPYFDISSWAAGKSDVQIRFVYNADFDYYVLLDNVTVVGW